MSSHDVTLGKVVGVFGIKGWVKVQSYSSPVENIFSYPSWNLVFPDQSQKPFKLRDCKVQGKGLVASLDGVTDRDQAHQLMGAMIQVGVDQLPELEPGEFYWYQLEGLRVISADGVRLGVIDHLMETGANDVLVVKPDQDSVDERERLIPYLPDQVVTRIDLESGLVTVDWDPEF